MSNLPKIEFGDLLIILMVMLQVGATFTYAFQRNYHEAVLWLGAIVGNAGYLMMRLLK